MEHPNATWNDFSTPISQKDVSFQVSSNFLNDEGKLKPNWSHWAKRRKIFELNCKNIKLMLWKALLNPWTLTRKEDKTLLDFVNIAAQMDTLPVGAGRKKEDQSMDPNNGIIIKTLLTDLIPIMDRRTRAADN